MGEFVECVWEPQHGAMISAARRGGRYQAYVPDALCGWDFAIPPDLAGGLSESERRIALLNDSTAADQVGFARFLLQAESVGSSYIEDVWVAPRRLGTASAYFEQGAEVRDSLAIQVVANIAAMEIAVEAGRRAGRFELADLLDIHRALMIHSPLPQIAGRVRQEQCWIGGYTPLDARFVPPPHEFVPDLLDDLIEYVNGDAHPPLLQAALAHVQFETIHPFADGNGRTGRALIHVVLARRGLAPRLVAPVSVVLAREIKQYIAGLNRYRHVGPLDSPDREPAAIGWLQAFDGAMAAAGGRPFAYRSRIAELQEQWRGRLGRVRTNSSVDQLLRLLPGTPVLTVRSASRLLGVTPGRVGPAVDRLTEAGILNQRNTGSQRYRRFEAPEVLALCRAVDSELEVNPLYWRNSGGLPPVAFD